MRIMVVVNDVPYPLQNGQHLRIYHYVRKLRERHTFDLVSFSDGPAPEPVLDLFNEVHVFPRPAREEPANVWARIKSAVDVGQMVPISDEIREFIHRRQADYDLFWVSGDAMMPSMPEVDGPVLGDIVDDIVLPFWRELWRTRQPLAWVRRAKWFAMSYLYEKRYYGDVDRCLVVSEVDAAAYKKVCPLTPVEVIHNGVDEHAYMPQKGPEDDRTIVFEGNMGFRPNIDGVLYFGAEILPLIRREVPDVKFLIVGKNPPEAVRALSGPGVEVTGFVDDVRPYIEQAAVFVCPLRTGAGIKNKLLQAWSMGKAIVATSPSTGGLKAEDGVNLLVRDNPQAFADAVVALLRDCERRRALGAAGRETILDAYTWDRKAEQLEALMLNMVEGGNLRTVHA